MKRYEIKFLSSVENFETIKNYLKLDDLGFKEQYISRKVNNIYFDDLNFKNFFDSEDGVSRRLKLRLRWYDELFPKNFRPILEVKEKYGYLNSKKILKFKSYSFSDFKKKCRDLTFDEAKESENSGLFLEHLIDTFPVLMNTYQRNYFVSQNENIRVTMDYDLGYINFDNLLSSQNSFTNKLLIIEIKFDEEYYDLASNFITKIPLRIRKFSKYVTGIKELKSFL